MKQHSTIGIVRKVDVVQRELHVQLATTAAVLDVPPDCPIVLHGERIKLRLVQPGDRIAFTYSKSRDLLIANQIDVRSDRASFTDL